MQTDLTQHLCLRFDDVEAVEEGGWFSESRQRLRQRRAEKMGLDLHPPTRGHAASIIEFAEVVRDEGGTVLCHCGAGVSRSAAAALICLAVWQGAGSERACLEELRRVRKAAVPHRGLVCMADELLTRNGNLLAALDTPV